MFESPGPFNLAALIPLGAALMWTARLVYGRQGASSDDVLKLILTTAGWHLMLTGLIGLIVGMTGPLSLLVIIILPEVLIMVVGQFRQSERRALLDVLAIAAERRIPLDVAARAFGAERNDELGLRAMHLADLLASGVPLPEALRASGHSLPIDARLAVIVGHESGTLGPALRRISGLGQELDASLRAVAVKFMYFTFVLSVVIAILTFVMLFIVPTFDKMFREFELKLPAATLLLISLSRLVVLYFPLVALIYPVWLAILLPALLNYLGILPRGLPIVSWLTRRYDGALVLRTLALAVEQDRSLVETLRMLSWRYPLKSVRRRLLRAVAIVDQGQEWCEALVRVGLIAATDAAVLQAAQRVGNLGWALDEMADSSLRRSAYRWRAWLNVVAPVVLLSIGAVVGFIVIALFMPLIALVQGLTR